MGIVCFLETSTPTNAHVCGVGMCADIERQGTPPQCGTLRNKTINIRQCVTPSLRLWLVILKNKDWTPVAIKCFKIPLIIIRSGCF